MFADNEEEQDAAAQEAEYEEGLDCLPFISRTVVETLDNKTNLYPLTQGLKTVVLFIRFNV